MQNRAIPTDALLLGISMLVLTGALYVMVENSASLKGSVVQTMPSPVLAPTINASFVPRQTLKNMSIASNIASSIRSATSTETASSSASSAVSSIREKPLAAALQKQRMVAQPMEIPPPPTHAPEEASLRSNVESIDAWMLAVLRVFPFLEHQGIPISDTLHATYRATAGLYRTDRAACLRSIESCWQLAEILTRMDHIQLTIDTALVTSGRDDLRWTVYHMLQ